MQQYLRVDCSNLSIQHVCLHVVFSLLSCQGAALWHQGLWQVMRAAAANSAGDTAWPLLTSERFVHMQHTVEYTAQYAMLQQTWNRGASVSCGWRRAYLLSRSLYHSTSCDGREPYNTSHAAVGVAVQYSHGLAVSLMRGLMHVPLPSAADVPPCAAVNCE
jgi:hypothetical protein